MSDRNPVVAGRVHGVAYLWLPRFRGPAYARIVNFARIYLTFVLVSFVSLGIAACGDGPDEPSPSDTSSTQGDSSAQEETVLLFDEAKATTTDSGLRYIDEVEGTGTQPTPQSNVVVHYRGVLTDGTQFDSSYERGQPAEFRVGGVIPGFAEGILGMKEGGKRILYIPWQLAYGEAGNPPVIPQRADLIFEVELVEVR